MPADQTVMGTPIDPLRYGTYTVQPGDTFYGVAAQYGITGDTLFVLNGRMADPLPPGNVLRLPAAFSIPSHVVQEGETIYDIAAQYGVSAKALERANGLETREVEVGRYLRIPGREAPEPPPGIHLPEVQARGPVQVYPPTFAGRLTASGQPYSPDEFVVSHADFPFGTVVLLTNPATNEHTFAKVIDRGPVDETYVMDVSEAVAEKLGLKPNSEQEIIMRLIQ